MAVQKGSSRELAEIIAADRNHGASELARMALQAIVRYASEYFAKDTAEFATAINSFASELMECRPCMAPVWNMLQQVQKELVYCQAVSVDTLRKKVVEAAGRLEDDSLTAVSRVADYAESIVRSGHTVFTHSYSSTIAALFKRLQEKQVNAIVTESRPLYEGRKTAEMIAGFYIPVQFVTDAQIGIFVEQADMAMVGADSVLPDGSVVNKAGTYLLALACHDKQVPFYVCYESFKLRDPGMPKLEIEKMDPAELGFQSQRYITVNNSYSDVTPARFITAWINNAGILKQWPE